MRADLLIIGSGIAGLTAALRASREAGVLLVTKGELADGSTRHAQGGIAGAIDPADSPAAHVADTLAAGAGLCDEEAVRVLCEEGPDAIRALVGLGVGFDRADGRAAFDGVPSADAASSDDAASSADGRAGADEAQPYALCLEGAHSRPRILHAGGDATGLAIETALVAAVREAEAAGRISVMEHAALLDLLVVEGRVRGAALLAADGTRLEARARAVLLATGGAGQLFAHTTNPAVATGDGTAAAWRAGAALEDLEFFQFHPTALVEGSFLVSEAVRGEGALLLDEQGRRFMPAVDERAELAPRDVVARAIARVMADQDGRPVLLDATAIGAERLAARFPTIDAAVRAAGIDWSAVPVPVTPAAHYWMGGIRTDLAGRTTLPGLYAAGECARTGVHGANRLASNSLLEGAVFGARAADAVLAQLAGPSSRTTTTASLAAVSADAAAGVAPADATTAADSSAADAARPDAARSDDAALPAGSVDAAPPTPGGAEEWTRSDLQELMWEQVGLLRTGDELDAAAERLAGWRVPDPATITTLAQLEDRNLLDLARLTTAHALARPLSVGAHHRLDAPSEALAC
ncbi:L-aspartate oxidase [Brachybacterium sp. DNPG3]